MGLEVCDHGHAPVADEREHEGRASQVHDRHGLCAQERRGASSASQCECARACGSLALGKGTVTQSEVLGLPKAQLICLVGCERERRGHLLQRRLVGAAPSAQEHDALKVGHQGALDGWNPLQLRLKVGGSARHRCDAAANSARAELVRVSSPAEGESEAAG